MPILYQMTNAPSLKPQFLPVDSIAVGQLSHALSSYRIDARSGQLIKLKEYPMGKNPNWVEIVELPSAG